MHFKYFSGVKPTGEFHIGNYANIIKPIIDNNLQEQTLVLIADLHALTGKNKNIKNDTINIFKILKAFGINNIKVQSYVPYICKLYWILSCYTAKGLLNRSHSYKMQIEENVNKGYDPDKKIFMGMYSYPILMAADLMMFDTDYVFIGDDQKQHVNIANDIADKFNYINKTDIFKVPEPIITTEVIEGFDGRKMSKSYNNTIPLMCTEKQLKEHINKVKTNSKQEGEPKEYNESPLTNIFDVFANDKDKIWLQKNMKNGLSWKNVKEFVFEKINDSLIQYRKRYNEIVIDDIVLDGDLFDVEFTTKTSDKTKKIRDIIF